MGTSAAHKKVLHYLKGFLDSRFRGNDGIRGMDKWQEKQNIETTGVSTYKGFRGNDGIRGMDKWQEKQNIETTGVSTYKGFRGNDGTRGRSGNKEFPNQEKCRVSHPDFIGIRNADLQKQCRNRRGFELPI
jgi:hypothetical protein